jgi:hypothetical protein
MAVYWLSERTSAVGHAWPRTMAAARGLDGTGISLQFFANVRAAAASEEENRAGGGGAASSAAVVSADVFPLVAQFSPCAAGAGRGGPCADAAPERPPPITAGCF